MRPSRPLPRGRGTAAFRLPALLSAAALASLVVLPIGANGQAPASTVPEQPSSVGHWAPYPGGDVAPLASVAPAIVAGSCTYDQKTDRPHISSSAPLAASVHGYWIKESGTCPSKATITVGLQAYRCDLGCYWVDVSISQGDVYAGGGSGKWVAARRTCSGSTKMVGWRAWVDADLIGISDPSGKSYGPFTNLACSP